MSSRIIDHIVYSVPNLEESMDYFKELLGVRPVFGGYHKTQGTKNAILNLGNACYLEILATDDSNTSIPPPRWMGIDVLKKSQITRWALKSDNLEADSTILNKYNADMGQIYGGSRNSAQGYLLQWRMILPLALPEVEIAPFMVDWKGTEKHPCDELGDMECELLELSGTHNSPTLLENTLRELGYDLAITKSESVSIKATIRCPNGIVEI